MTCVFALVKNEAGADADQLLDKSIFNMLDWFKLIDEIERKIRNDRKG